MKDIHNGISWSNTNVWGDLTTIGQWQKHVNKYTPEFGET